MGSIHILGSDGLPLVFANLEPRSLMAAEAVCREWRRILCDQDGIALWKPFAVSVIGDMFCLESASDLQLNAVQMADHTRQAEAQPEPQLQSVNCFSTGATRLRQEAYWWKSTVMRVLGLRRLGGVPVMGSFQTSSDDMVIVDLQVSAAGENTRTCTYFILEDGADFDNDRAIRSTIPFPAPTSVAGLTFQGGVNTGQAVVPQPLAARNFDGCIASSIEIAALQCWYYEVKLERLALSNGEVCVQPPPDHPNECIAIGLATERFRLTGRQPGWTKNSCGWHGDDGQVFVGSGIGQTFGPRFGKGDTVGCGICLGSGAVFFTLNGNFVGIACVWMRDQPIYPAIGVGSYTRGRISYGQHPEAPFQFDVRQWPYFREKFGYMLPTDSETQFTDMGMPAEGFARRLASLTPLPDRFSSAVSVTTSSTITEFCRILEQRQQEGDEDAGALRVALQRRPHIYLEMVRERFLVRRAGAMAAFENDADDSTSADSGYSSLDTDEEQDIVED